MTTGRQVKKDKGSAYRILVVWVAALLIGAATGSPGFAAPNPVLPDSPRMQLDEIGIYSVGYAYRNASERWMPTGWSGDFDESTGVACRPDGKRNGKSSFLLHCPWRNGTGAAMQEFQFLLPIADRILLSGSTAMRPDSVGKSDGAVFRIVVNGRALLDRRQSDANWKPFRFDLTRLRGQVVTVRFVTDPGPRDDPGFDFTLWGDRVLSVEGFRPRPYRSPSPSPLSLTRLAPRRNGDVVPISSETGKTVVRRNGDIVRFRWTGSDGSLEYRWVRPSRPEDPFLGRLYLRARMTGEAMVELPLAGDARIAWDGAAIPIQARFDPSAPATLRRDYRVDGRVASVTIRGSLIGKSLVLSINGDRTIRRIDIGRWGPVLRRRPIPVPYYSGQIQYLPRENLFVNAFLDWTDSDAAALDGSAAIYRPLTDGSRGPVRERAIFSASWRLPEVFPNIPNPPSPYLRQVGGRIVLDSWGGSFDSIRRNLEELTGYGIRDSILLVHVWQRSGYDNALPAHFPANESQGGDAAMRSLVTAGRRLGYLVALHENYVDYYPNYERFNERDIALEADGRRQNAWYNPGTGIQSFAVKPNAILPLARGQSPEIRRRYGTNASYLDVHSAVPPWFHVDQRAGEPGAGRFQTVWEAHRDLFRYERDTHSGPVFGEGNNHWFWSGLLDGVEAQFGQGWPSNAGLSAPLMVDFDLLRIHPLQINHGMGYYERWWDRSKWGRLPPISVLDQYRMQEVVYGHAGFLGGAVLEAIPIAWLEHHLLSPVMKRYAGARVASIEYQVGGRWVDGTVAAKASQWRRVRVRYDNGLTVTANDAPESLRVGSWILPRFGWMAKGAGVTAGTSRRQGMLSDFAETPISVFACARNEADFGTSGIHAIRPIVERFEQLGPRRFRAVYRWWAGEKIKDDFNAFVHFTHPSASNDGIRFQGDHALIPRTSDWQPGGAVIDGPWEIVVPSDAPDGSYNWTIGLYQPGGGRLTLEGVEDGSGRIRLGQLIVSDNGNRIAFVLERATGEERKNAYKKNLNPGNPKIDFGPVRTDGSVILRREGVEWVALTFPRNRRFLLELDPVRFGIPSIVRCAGGASATVRPVKTGRKWRLYLNGATAYRWRIPRK